MLTPKEIYKFGVYKGRFAVKNVVVVKPDKDRCACSDEKVCETCVTTAAKRYLELEAMVDDDTKTLLKKLYELSKRRRRSLYRKFLKGKKRGIDRGLYEFYGIDNGRWKVS